MPRRLRVEISLLMVGVAFVLGYGVATWRGRPGEVPSRAVAAGVPAGLASDLRAALLEPDLLVRTARVAGILGPLGPDALTEVQAGFGSVLADTGDVELALFADWWARFDAPAAFEWARAERLGWHPTVLTTVVRTWARQGDPEAASRAVRNSVRDERLIAAAMLGLVRGWEESGRDGLVEHLAGLPAGTARGIEVLARGAVARQGFEKAIAWAEDLGMEDEGPNQASFQSELVERIVEATVDRDPVAVASWVERRRGDVPEPRGALSLVLRLSMRWAQNDGEAAMRWLSTLPPAGDMRAAVRETYRTWYLKDQAAATAWIRAAEIEPWLEPAVGAFAVQRSAKDPDEAVEWAMRVRDPEIREQTLVKIGVGYSVTAPAEVDAWLARTQLPDSVRQRIEAFRSRRAGGGAAAQAAAGSGSEAKSLPQPVGEPPGAGSLSAPEAAAAP
jgi:hypothetical protein